MSENNMVRRTLSGASIIDRTGESKHKSVGNFNRFLKRNRDAIRKQVNDIIRGRKIGDIDKGADITIGTTEEPEFRIRPGSGERDFVLPGNEEYSAGDQIRKPRKGGKGPGGGGSEDGEGEDSFSFHLDRDQFLDVFFEDLALPNMVRKLLADITEVMFQRAGITLTGNPSSVNVYRTMRQNIMRDVATGESEEELAEAERELAEAIRALGEDHERVREIRERIIDLKESLFIDLDEHDLRYRNRVVVPKPTTKAVMFCIMDVSGSMDEEKKDCAKRFFWLLYMFLRRSYERIDVVFIRHHTQAMRSTEEEFFNLRESGGTVVSSALELCADIIDEEYPPESWNSYVAQASDGDNFNDDNKKCAEILLKRLLPKTAYFAYIEIADKAQELWETYGRVTGFSRKQGSFAMKRVRSFKDIFPVFHQLFKKKGVQYE